MHVWHGFKCVSMYIPGCKYICVYGHGWLQVCMHVCVRIYVCIVASKESLKTLGEVTRVSSSIK